MTNWLKKRSKEKSTWLGLATITAGLGALLKADGVPELANTVAQNADSLAAGDYALTGLAVLSGLFNLFTKEDK